MAPDHAQRPLESTKKRKDPPISSNPSTHKKRKVDHRARQRDARILSTQTSSKAFQNGALDVSAFVKAREYEIQALEQGMQRSGKANSRRAFQQVPKELRRRTASHNAKRIPKRLRKRAEKEMVEDNTPTVTSRNRKPTRHMRMRLETAKRLRVLGATKEAAKKNDTAKAGLAHNADPVSKAVSKDGDPKSTKSADSPEGVKPRKARVKKTSHLAMPSTPGARFRKRQIHKTWLPTHLFHSKRAHMTPPSAPLWRFAIPLTPTQKGYRAIHRAANSRGAVAWDMSYMGTIGLQGRESSIDTIFRGIGVDSTNKDVRWKNGTRVRLGWAKTRESKEPIAPVTLIWCARLPQQIDAANDSLTQTRRAFIRVHPSAFFQLWEEVGRLARVAKPSVLVEDLRFEVGSIEIGGPGSTEALLGALWPTANKHADSVEHTWTCLAGLTDPSALPKGALLAFNVQDPRLHHPPRTMQLPKSDDTHARLLQTVAEWPTDRTQAAAGIFDRTARQKGAKLASQKAINRRRTLSAPGRYPDSNPNDPQIPVLLYATPRSASTAKDSRQSTWTVLAPWKCIQPIWYSVQYYPLSTGQQPRFGGLDEQRQLAFETGQPWFPADFPGTNAGWAWEIDQRGKRLEEWKKRPKGKRVSWETIDMGGGRKGEVGRGYACDWEWLLELADRNAQPQDHRTGSGAAETPVEDEPVSKVPRKPALLSHLTHAQAFEILKASSSISTERLRRLATVRITLITRGVPQVCARIYKLPSAPANAKLRAAWLAMQPPKGPSAMTRGNRRVSLARPPKDAPPHVLQQQLAQSLLRPPDAGTAEYPACPDEDQLIGFVTSGNFNLAEGRGTGVGCAMIGGLIEDEQALDEEGKLCVVRNAGESVARLAKWEIV